MNDQGHSRVKHEDGTVPDVICHGGGELSESTHGESGADGQRPGKDTPDTRNTSAEELSEEHAPEGGVPTTEGNQPTHDTPGGEEGVGEQPEPEFISPVTFKTSGTFLRDKVARSLAEQGFGPEDASEGAVEETSGVPADTHGTDASDVSDSSPEAGSPASASTTGAEEPDERPEGVRGDDWFSPADRSSATEDTSADRDGGEPSSPVSAPTEPISLDALRAGAPAPEASTDASENAGAEDDGADVWSSHGQGGTGATKSPVAGTVTDVQDWPEEPAESTAPTSAVPAAPDAVAPDRGGEQTLDESSAAETASLWPEPRRLSTYVSGTPSHDEQDRGVRPGSAAAAAGAAGAAAAYSGAPGGPAGPGSGSGAGPGGMGSSSNSGGPSGPTGPGGPKGPAGPGGTGPGGPKGPGDPKARGRDKKAKKPLWWRILRVFLIVIGVFVIAGCGVFAYFYTTVEVPDAAKADVLEEGSTFYFADGETEFAYRGTYREILSYDEMTAGGDHVVEAVISAEDRGFWTEPGVSVSGTSRAVWSTVSGQQVQGGSTITQQMVRNYYEGINRDVSITRKVREIIIALKVDRSESKEWVMEQYLNTIYFGRNAYGVQAASQAYYHKDVQELEPAEAAFLAAAIQQPTPFGEADVETTPEMERRWGYVVNGMVTTGAITQAEADAMEFPAPEPERPSEGTDLSGYKGYMLQEAMNELERLGYTEDQVNRQGYKIVTTFDQDMMEVAYETVEETIAPEDLPEGVNVGLTTIDPETGEVLAFYGGHDYWENQYDSAFLGAAQTGSAFKPYVLATALEQGYSLNSTVDGRGPRTIAGSRIQNAGNSAGGVMNLIQATQVSNNLGYIELAQEVGFENVRDTVYSAGWPEGSIADSQLVPVMPLGASSARPVDQASGYATFANGGVHVEAHVVREIIDSEGENVRPEVKSNRALEESTAADVTYALQQVVNSGTGTGARLANHPTAGKTGTTDGSVAAWFVGYTPQLSTAVGVYSGNNESFSVPGYGSLSGGTLPATLWNRYMTNAMEGYEPGSFPSPAFGGTTENWAPDVSTEQPSQQQQEQPQAPVEPETPEAPVEPEAPTAPEAPTQPEWPEFPGPGDPGTDPGTDPGADPGAGGGGGGESPPARRDDFWG
jgi:membrane peptidoglycan carboxypeptidase